jgi:hypothetical protein
VGKPPPEQEGFTILTNHPDIKRVSNKTKNPYKVREREFDKVYQEKLQEIRNDAETLIIDKP